MAKALVWADLSADQLERLRSPQKGASTRELLAKFLGFTDPSSHTQAIMLDMYTYTLQFGQELQLTADKLSCLVSIMKTVHTQSTQNRMTVDKSFAMFKDIMIQHSVQRPPRSIGLYTMQEFKQIVEWVLDTYYRHYTLYQYAFTDRVSLSVTQTHPSDIVETVPVGGLQPLQAALTQDQHFEVVKKEEQQKAEVERAAADAEAAEVERQRIEKLREEYEASIPDEIRDRVQAAVERELVHLKESLEAQFQTQQQELLNKINTLETKLSQTPNQPPGA